MSPEPKVYTFDNDYPTERNWVEPEQLKGAEELFAA
jgi:hypothetical protein